MTRSRRAILSVSDKTGLEPFARALAERGFEILSTGGTARVLREAGIPVTAVTDVTGHAEIMGGRVKTLHPAILGPLLARRDVPGDLEALDDHGYALIDLVAVNLYPFRETIARGGVPVGEAMEQVDIGGPTMLRSAAKNHPHVLVVVDPADYAAALAVLDASDAPDVRATRRAFAAKVFGHVSAYDAAVAEYLEAAPVEAGEAPPNVASRSPASGVPRGEGASGGFGPLPAVLTLSGRRVQTLRYGENPDQAAAFYAPEAGAGPGLSGLRQHHGKELSYNNILDLDGAALALAPFALSPRPAVCIVKHTTPCGLAVGDSVADAYRKALRTDPVSAFGSVIATNRTIDGPAAEAMSELFVECVVAPGYTEDALETLSRKKNVRILSLPAAEVPRDAVPVPRETLASFDGAPGIGEDARLAARFFASHGRVPEAVSVRSVHGGFLAQSPPVPPFFGLADPAWKVVTKRAPSDAERTDLAFAWAAAAGVKSNAILLASDGATIGIGAGQMSRVDASRLAVQKAADAGIDPAGCALASDAFFPFRDGVDAAAAAGVRAIIQPGGSIRDHEVIDAADEHGIAMVFTGRRLFRH